MGYFFGFAFIISFGFFLAGYKKYGKGGRRKMLMGYFLHIYKE